VRLIISSWLFQPLLLSWSRFSLWIFIIIIISLSLLCAFHFATYERHFSRFRCNIIFFTFHYFMRPDISLLAAVLLWNIISSDDDKEGRTDYWFLCSFSPWPAVFWYFQNVDISISFLLIIYFHYFAGKYRVEIRRHWFSLRHYLSFRHFFFSRGFSPSFLLVSFLLYFLMIDLLITRDYYLFIIDIVKHFHYTLLRRGIDDIFSRGYFFSLSLFLFHELHEAAFSLIIIVKMPINISFIFDYWCVAYFQPPCNAIWCWLLWADYV